MTDAAAPPRRRRRWPYWAAAVLLVLGVAGTIAWRARVDLAEQAARAILAEFDIGADVEFVVTAFETDRIRLEDVRLPGGPSVTTAEITFDPSQLADGRLKTLRLVDPALKLVVREDGGVDLIGLERWLGGDSAAAPTDPSAERFPDLPGVDRVEIENALIQIDGAAGAFDVAVDLTLNRDADDAAAYRVDLRAAGQGGGRDGTLRLADSRLVVTPAAAMLTGRVDIAVDAPTRGQSGEASVWLDLKAAPTGATTLDALLMTARGAVGPGPGRDFADARGRIRLGIGPGGVEMAAADLQIDRPRFSPVAYDLATVALDLRHGAASVSYDAVGPSGNLRFAVDAPQTGGRLAVSARGEIDASHISILSDRLAAVGRVRFVADATADVDAMLRKPDYRHVAGAIELIVETPDLRIDGLAPTGSARGTLNVKLKDGAATLTSPGLLIGGVNLPEGVLANLPAEIAKAFAEPAFVRLGGDSLDETIVTAFEQPEGGIAAFGKLGLGVSNPNLAVFIEGDGFVAMSAEGAVERVESDRLTMRLVDVALGPARVGGAVVLERLSGAAGAYDAGATLALGARIQADAFTVKEAEIDLSGPLTLTDAEAKLLPNADGEISIAGYAGPQLALPRTLRLKLNRNGGRSIVYDRTRDRLAAKLDFRGFKTVGVLNPDADAGDVEIGLGGLGVQVGDDGAVLTLRNAGATFPDYGLALAGGDARIAFGGAKERAGRLTIKEIRQLSANPMTRPLSLELDVRGRGDFLSFKGALIAANDRARLAMTGEHHLATGVGRAALKLGPVVFAPGLLQPQDFAPPLYRVLLETIGQAKLDAEVAWDPDGYTTQTATVDFTVDKLRTSEITLENASSEFAFDRLFEPRSAGAQRISVGLLDVGVPLTRGVIDVNLISPTRIDAVLQRFEMFGGVISSQRFEIDPTSQEFDLVLEVSDIDLASILAFAEFGELQATGKLGGRIPIRYRNGELRIDGGVLKTGLDGGNLRYRPREVDTALSDVDRSSKLALKALSNFAYDVISIEINEVEDEELRLDIHIAGTSVDLYEGVPFEFNIVIEGPIRQLLEENLAPVDLSRELQDLTGRRNAGAGAQPVQ